MTLRLLLFYLELYKSMSVPNWCWEILCARFLEEQFLNLKESTIKHIFGFVSKMQSQFEEPKCISCVSNKALKLNYIALFISIAWIFMKC